MYREGALCVTYLLRAVLISPAVEVSYKSGGTADKTGSGTSIIITLE